MQWVRHTTELQFKEDDVKFQRVRLEALNGLPVDELIKLERDILEMMISRDSPPALRHAVVKAVGEYMTWSKAAGIHGQNRFNSTVQHLVGKFSDADANVRKADVEIVGELRSEVFISELNKN